MADQESGVIDPDFAEHEKTFARFTALVKWASIGIAILLVLMAIFLVK